MFPYSVRLECVMHAASVNPEPGSNSLKNRILNRLTSAYYLLELLSSFYYFLSFSCVLNEICTIVLLNLSCVVQFSMIKAPKSKAPSKVGLIIILHLFPLVKGFLKVFCDFFNFFFISIDKTRDGCYNTFSTLCKRVLKQGKGSIKNEKKAI